MVLEIQCSAELNGLLYSVKNILNIIMIIAPILAIISFTVLLVKLSMNPEEKKLIKNLTNATKALVIIFFIPMLVNIAMSLAGNNTNISSCYLNATSPNTNTTYMGESEKEKEKESVLTDKKDYEGAEKKQLAFKCKPKLVNGNFSCETLHIVERHLNDFNYYTFNSVINSYGGFDKYVDTLGGVFKKYYGKKVQVETVEEFQLISEYVFGFMTMYGFDYYCGRQCDSNGKNCEGLYCKWGGQCMPYLDLEKAAANNTLDSYVYPTGTSDAFYPGQFRYENNGLSDSQHFDDMVSGKSGLNMTTNCNWTVDMVYFKAGIFGTGRTKTNSSCNYLALYQTSKKVIYKAEDLEVGDILNFFKSPVPDGTDPSAWGAWRHAAYVGETHKDEGYITVYDGGTRLTEGRTHKWTIPTDGTDDNTWVGFRVVDLK